MTANKKVIQVMLVMSLLFLSLIGYLTYFEFFVKDKIVSNPYNRRQWEVEESTRRGDIYDRNGTLLATSKIEGDKQTREYPFGSLYSHVIGYNSRNYGKSMLEAAYNNELLGIREFSSVFDIKNKLIQDKKPGNNLVLTIDHNLQAATDQLLGEKRGAVVALDPKSGEVLAMVSKPDFDPNSQKLAENWTKMVESKESPFLSRVLQGLYAPGSTFKTVISASAIENGLGNRILEDKGVVTIDGKEFRNFGGGAHGTLDLKTALAVSSNVYFSQLGVELGAKNLQNAAEKAGIGSEIPFDLPVSRSLFPYKSMSKADMGAVGIGQGKILVTPLHMAMIAAGIANNGTVMKPILVNRVMKPDETILKQQKSSELYRMMKPETAKVLKEMMQGVVDSGTGGNAAIQGVRVAGKTGTAENEMTGREKNKEHAWFIGFAPAENPKIAVAVILEYSGETGGQGAAPIARDLMAAWLNGGK